jgi:hypothetical protein
MPSKYFQIIFYDDDDFHVFIFIFLTLRMKQKMAFNNHQMDSLILSLLRHLSASFSFLFVTFLLTELYLLLSDD